jgi:hypothetical protein
MEERNLAIVFRKEKPVDIRRFKMILEQIGAADIFYRHGQVSARINPDKFEDFRAVLIKAGAEFRKLAYSKVDGTIFKFRF